MAPIRRRESIPTHARAAMMPPTTSAGESVISAINILAKSTAGTNKMMTNLLRATPTRASNRSAMASQPTVCRYRAKPGRLGARSSGFTACQYLCKSIVGAYGNNR